MRNLKAAQRDQLIYEFGLLVSPIHDLVCSNVPPAPNAYRLALAQIQSGDREWRTTAKSFATFPPDIVFNTEYGDISHVPERMWLTIKIHLDDPELVKRPSELQAKVSSVFHRSRTDLFEFIDRVPINWESVTFAATTPFTSYLRIRESVASVTSRLHYFDRYLKPEFFSLFLAGLERGLEIRLITTARGVAAVRDISELFRQEYRDYMLLETTPDCLHDRNLRIDHLVFALGPGVDRAGMALTNFGPADDSSDSHASFDRLIASTRVVHRS